VAVVISVCIGNLRSLCHALGRSSVARALLVDVEIVTHEIVTSTPQTNYFARKFSA
jgi:hypothetical protein